MRTIFNRQIYLAVNSLRDGIYHEFKKCGKVKSVLIRGEGNYRYALVLFRNASEANKAIGHARTKLLFGAAIEASLYDGEGERCWLFYKQLSYYLFVGSYIILQLMQDFIVLIIS